MSGTEDQGLAAVIGAALMGAASGIGVLLRGRRQRRQPEQGDPPPPLPPPPAEPSALSVRIGAVAARVDTLEKELTMLKHNFATKMDRLEESVDELGKSNAVSAALLPEIRAQLHELRQDLRQRATTKD